MCIPVDYNTHAVPCCPGFDREYLCHCIFRVVTTLLQTVHRLLCVRIERVCLCVCVRVHVCVCVCVCMRVCVRDFGARPNAAHKNNVRFSFYGHTSVDIELIIGPPSGERVLHRYCTFR